MTDNTKVETHKNSEKNGSVQTDTDSTSDKIQRFEGIIGNNCGIVKPYIGTDRRLTEKGYIVENGLPTMRGYAKISDLAAASISRYKEYQRKHDGHHTEAIKTFLEHGKDEAKFLPEVILSVNDPSRVVFKKYEHKSISSITGKGVIENMGYCVLEVTGQALSRVDGNHRLEAGKFSDYYIPFSIILWNSEIWDDPSLLYSVDNARNIETEAFLFYFLNNTAKRLALEENYKGLIKAENWTNEELQKVDKVLPILKHFNEKWIKSPIFNCQYLCDNPLEQIGQVLSDINNSELDENAFDRCIQETIDILKQTDKLKYIKEEYPDIVAQLVFYAVYNKVEDEKPLNTLIKMDKWFEEYKYTGEIFTNAKKMYEVAMKQIRVKKVRVFVAMPYYDEPTVKHYNDIFSSACAKIEEEGSSVEISTYDIMSFKGKTFDIEADIMDKINQCDIFVADITTSNPNVMYELGIAAKAKKLVIILKKDKDKAKVPSDIILKFYVRFNDCMDLKDKMYENLKAILIEDCCAVFPK